MSEKTRAWLFSYLLEANDPVPSRQVISAGEEEGFARTAIHRARQALNISVIRTRSVPSMTYWAITAESIHPSANPHGRRLPAWAREELTQCRDKIKELIAELQELRAKINTRS